MFTQGQPLYMLLYASGIIFFSFFYTNIVFNPKETAENLRKYGGYIPGIRPGERSAEYIETILMRLTTIGSIYLTFVCLMPEFLISKYPIPFYLGGTSILIVVVVAMDTVTQVQTRLMSSQYESLIKKTKFGKIVKMNVIIFGPPGAGKGTQSNFISKKFNLLKLSTGEILRDQIKQKTDLGIKISPIINSGAFVSDEIVSELIEKVIKDKKNYNRIIFDGYPRSLTQAKNLDNLLIKYKQKIGIVLKLSVTLETIKKKEFPERRTLENRPDDNEEIAVKRYETYEKSTEPVIEYYKKLNLLKVINGERSIHQINNEISDIINLI